MISDDPEDESFLDLGGIPYDGDEDYIDTVDDRTECLLEESDPPRDTFGSTTRTRQAERLAAERLAAERQAAERLVQKQNGDKKVADRKWPKLPKERLSGIHGAAVDSETKRLEKNRRCASISEGEIESLAQCLQGLAQESSAPCLTRTRNGTVTSLRANRDILQGDLLTNRSKITSVRPLEPRSPLQNDLPFDSFLEPLSSNKTTCHRSKSWAEGTILPTRFPQLVQDNSKHARAKTNPVNSAASRKQGQLFQL